MPAQRKFKKPSRKIVIKVPERIENVTRVITSRSDRKTGRILEYLVELDNHEQVWAKPSAIADSEAYKLYKKNRKDDIQLNIWIVEEIIEKRRNEADEMEFLAVWAGYPMKAASWEPKSSFQYPFDEDTIPWVEGQSAEASKHLENTPSV